MSREHGDKDDYFAAGQGRGRSRRIQSPSPNHNHANLGGSSTLPMETQLVQNTMNSGIYSDSLS